MDESLEFLLFFAIITTIALCFVMIPTILALRSSKKSKLQQSAKPEKLKLSVTVMNMRCGVKMVGIKTPKTVKEFWVAFRTEDGHTFELPVRDAMYHGFEEGQTGTLTLVNGQVYSFVLKKQAVPADNA